jgi:hypothetical protein
LLAASAMVATDRPILRVWYTLTANAATNAASSARDSEMAFADW